MNEAYPQVLKNKLSKFVRSFGAYSARGYGNVHIEKNFVENIADVKVYLDGDQINYTATSLDDSWLLHFTYLRSMQEVTISLSSISLLFIEIPFGKVIIFGVSLTAIAILILFVLRKKNR